MNSYGHTLVSSYDYCLMAESVPVATKLHQASEYLCIQVVK